MHIRTSDLTTAFAELLQGVATTSLPPDAVRAAKDRLIDALSVTFDGVDLLPRRSLFAL